MKFMNPVVNLSWNFWRCASCRMRQDGASCERICCAVRNGHEERFRRVVGDHLPKLNVQMKLWRRLQSDASCKKCKGLRMSSPCTWKQERLRCIFRIFRRKQEQTTPASLGCLWESWRSEGVFNPQVFDAFLFDSFWSLWVRVSRLGVYLEVWLINLLERPTMRIWEGKGYVGKLH